MVGPTAEISSADVLERAKREAVKFVNLQFSDVTGIVKSVTIPVDQLKDALENGKWFDGSSIEGFARIAESDMYLKLDPSTFAVIPWERGDDTTARIVCWVYTPKGEPFEGDPRFVLKRAMDEAAALGYSFNTGPELEFFLFKPSDNGRLVPTPHDTAGYFDFSTDVAAHVRKQMVNALNGFGIRVETSHHEVAMGQHEIDFQYDQALKSADNAVTLRYTLKAIAQRHGLHATFMPKPIFGVAGNGMHVHQSFARLDNGHNAFADESDEYGLSAVAKSFIAGQPYHARGMSAILAPLVNSYKRLVPGYEAPVYISVGARQPLGPHPRAPGDQGKDAVDAPGTALSRSELQPVSGLCGNAEVRPGWHQAQPAAARAGRGESVSLRRRRAEAAQRRYAAGQPRRGARRTRARRGRAGGAG